MVKLLAKNLKKYSVVAFSFNNNFHSINFKPDEVKDLSGIQIDTEENFDAFVRTYVLTNILTLIPIYVDSSYIPIPEDGYFDFDYIEYGWIV